MLTLLDSTPGTQTASRWRMRSRKLSAMIKRPRRITKRSIRWRGATWGGRDRETLRVMAMDSDRHAPQPWYRTERRRNAQQGLETAITVTEQTLHEKVGKLRKRFRTRKLLPLLSAWYVAVVQERQGNPELVEYTLADRLGGAMRTLAEYRDALPRTARASDVQLRDTLCELVDTKTAQTLVPERSDAPMLTYVGFQ